jgi:hypothetical protein
LSPHKKGSPVAFCEANSAVYMRDVTVDLLETFKVEGFPEGMAETSKATAVAKLRCFLRTAYRRDWINEALVEVVLRKVATAKKRVLESEPQSSRSNSE